jgi:hypothetical protein
MALVELETPVAVILPAKLNQSTNELHSNVVGVGFGASGVANNPAEVKGRSIKIAGENVIDSFIGEKYPVNQTLMVCDFDHPTRLDCNKTGSPTPRPLEYVTSGGDSGGGLFRQKGDGWELVGICHGGGVNLDQLIKSGFYGQTMG